jgi:crotonobetainyl-CoA:carnitine CoA-transferase CaiB-like acyl-CoA transferase
MGAFGSRGPWRTFRAYGSTVEQASGLPFINGHPEDPPTMQHVAYGDPVGGLYGAIAGLTALYASHKRRVSTWVDLGQVECLFQLGADAIIAQSLRDDPLPREGSAHPASILRTCVPTVHQGEWLAVSIETEQQRATLARIVGRVSDLEEALESWSAHLTAEDAAAALQEAGVPVAPVRPTHELLNDPQLGGGFWQQLERRFIGTHVVPRPPYRLDGASPPLNIPAPTLGEHNHEILGERIGLGAAELARLEQQGVIGTRASLGAS